MNNNSNSIDNSRHTTHKGVPLKGILDTFGDLLNLIDGEANITVYGPCSQSQPARDGLVFVGDEKHLLQLFESAAAALVVPAKLVDLALRKNKDSDKAHKKTLISTTNTYLSMARVNHHFFALPFLRAPFDDQKIHKTASVSPKAAVADGVIIGPGAVVFDGVKIGRNSFIGANTVIEAHSTIGENCFIHPHVYIGHTCQIGNRVEIKPNSTIGSDGYGYAHDTQGQHYRIPHYGAVHIEDDVHIGANVNIDRGTFDPAIIGAGTKIDNHCHFGHNVRIGKNCLITAGMITAGSATIGDNCIFGGRASINGHISIVSGCTFGGLTAITKNITKPGMYAGFPAIPYKDSLKVQTTAIHLPRFRKNLSLVMKKLGLSEDEKASE